MALTMTIAPSVYDKLPADIQKEYKKSGDDYVLDLVGYEDPTALRNARDHEKAEAAQAKKDAAAEKRRADAAEKEASDLKAAGKSVDDAVKAKDAEWQAKYDADLKAEQDKYGALTGSVTKSHKDAIANTLATKLSTAPKLLARDIADRIDVEIDPKTNEIKSHILGSDGKRTSWTMADLEKDILKNPEYAPILRGTKATGGGGAPPAPGGGGAPRHTPTPGTPAPSFANMPAAELAEIIRADKEAQGRA